MMPETGGGAPRWPARDHHGTGPPPTGVRRADSGEALAGLLPRRPTHMTPYMTAQGPNGPDPIDSDWPTLDELSLRYLHRVIEHARGNKTKAAEVLGIDRR